jgi:hypothetical protein
MTKSRFLPTAVLSATLAVAASSAPWGAGGVSPKDEGGASPRSIARPTPAGAVVSGGGVVNVTDVDGSLFAAAGEFSISGAEARKGARGRISFVFRGDFASYWGAVPGVTDLFYLKGIVTDITADGTNVVLSGLLSETDFARGQGVVFVEESVPFEITTQTGSSTFVMQFCELPPFAMDVVQGTLTVHAASLIALESSGARPLFRLASHATSPRTAAVRPQCAR